MELYNTDNTKTSAEKKKLILRQRAMALKVEEKKDIDSQEQIAVLEYILGNERYAIDSQYVTEVILLKDISPLPCVPDFILGIINVRGKIMSVIDIKVFFDLPKKGKSNLNRVILVKYGDIELGILADEILGTQLVSLNSLQKTITTITDVPENFIVGVLKDGLIVLDICEFLTNEKIIINDVV